MTDLLDGFVVRPQDLGRIGRALARPECVLALANGVLYASDQSAAVTRIAPDGTQERIGAIGGIPNGLAIDGRGRLFIANLEDGKIYRVDRHGGHTVWLDHFEGHALGSANFVYADEHDRLWITVSTRTVPRIDAVRTPTPDGYLLSMTPSGAVRQVATGYAFTNEVRIHAGWMYVAETALGRVSRHRLHADGSLGARETFGPEPVFPGAKIDGIAFDAAGNLWVTEVFKNVILVIDPQGRSRIVFEDPQAKHVDFPASIAFGGPDRRTAIVGSAKMDHLVTFRVPIAGAPMRHWSVEDIA